MNSKIEFGKRTDLLALSKSDEQGLRDDNPAIHFCNSFGGLVRRREAYESETFGVTLLIYHNLSAGNVTVNTELLVKTCIVDDVIKILNVQVYSWELRAIVNTV